MCGHCWTTSISPLVFGRVFVLVSGESVGGCSLVSGPVVRSGFIGLRLIRLGFIGLRFIRLRFIRLGAIRLRFIRLGFIRLGAIRLGVIGFGFIWLGGVLLATLRGGHGEVIFTNLQPR
jgi:hypothetical protein